MLRVSEYTPSDQLEPMISFAQDKIDKVGRLTNENAGIKIREVIYSLIVCLDQKIE